MAPCFPPPRACLFNSHRHAVRTWAVAQLATPVAEAAVAAVPSSQPGHAPHRWGLHRHQFAGMPRTLNENPSERNEMQELMQAARARHQEETARMKSEASAMRANGGQAAPPPPPQPSPGPVQASSMCFVRPVPAPAFHFPHDEASMASTTLAAAGLVPSGALHLLDATRLGCVRAGTTPINRGGVYEDEEEVGSEDDEDDELYGEDGDGMDVDDDDDAAPVPPPAPPRRAPPQAPDRAALAAAAMARAAVQEEAQRPGEPAQMPAPVHPSVPAQPSAPPVQPGREAALAAALARAATAVQSPTAAAVLLHDEPPARAAPPPATEQQTAAVRDAEAQRRAELAMAAAEARAEAAKATAQATPKPQTQTMPCGSAWRPTGAVQAAQDAADAAHAAERAAARVRQARVKQLLRDDRALRRFDAFHAETGTSVAAPVVTGAAQSDVACGAMCRARVVRPDGSYLTLRLPDGASLGALRLAALSSWNRGGGEHDAEQYGFLAHGGLELFGTDTMRASLAACGLTAGGGAVAGSTLHLAHAQQRGQQRHHHVIRRRDEDDEDEDEAVDNVLAGLVTAGWAAGGAGQLTYEQALALGDALGVVEVATPAGVVAALNAAPWGAGPEGPQVQPQRCVICMCDMDIGCHATRLPCNHALHGPCAAEWLSRATWCPLCKRRVAR